MILPNMTGKEMNDLIYQDIALMKRKLDALDEDWRRTVKKFPRTRYRTTRYHFKPSNQDYLIIHNHRGDNPNKRLTCEVYAVMKDEKQTYYVKTAIFNEGKQSVFIYTNHFFSRYRERMDLGDITLDHALAEHQGRGMFYGLTYFNEDNGQVVYTHTDGLCLCEFIPRYGYVILRTFVSGAMLKYSQFAAWNKALEATVEMTNWTELHNKNLEPYQTNKEAKAKADSIIDPISDEIQQIYAQYFEK